MFALRQERRDRRDELDLYRHQVNAEVEQREIAARDRKAQSHAEITAAQGGYGRKSGFGDYEFTLKNLGPVIGTRRSSGPTRVEVRCCRVLAERRQAETLRDFRVAERAVRSSSAPSTSRTFPASFSAAAPRVVRIAGRR